MKSSEIWDRLMDAAKTCEPVRAARIAAALVHRGEIVALETNVRKSHPFQKKYGKNDDAIFLHAETHVIVKSLKRLQVDDLSDSELFVARVKKNPQFHYKGEWEVGLSKPCEGCQRCLATFNISRVWYTEDGGKDFVCL